MRLDDIKCFLEVSRVGGIRKAAERLNIASSAVSRHIAHLESSLDARLFDRQGRGMTLTPAGHLYVQYARDLLARESRIQSELTALKGLNKGHVCINSTEGHGADFVTHLIASFRRKYPGVTFELIITSTKNILIAVQEGTADIGIAFMPEPLRGIESAISIKAPILAVMAPTHPLATKAHVNLAETLSYPLALPDQSFGIRRILESIGLASNLTFTPALVTNSISAMKGFARHAGGISFLTEMSIVHEVEIGALVGVPISDPTLRRTTIEVCMLGQRRLPSAVSAFLRHIKSETAAIKSNNASEKRLNNR